MTTNTITNETAAAWLRRVASETRRREPELTALDGPIGDSDHGFNLARGFAAVAEKLDPLPPDPAGVFKLAAMTLLSTVGGASGPLFATIFLKLAEKAAGKTELNLNDWRECLRAGLEGLAQRGKAEPGDKTMLDALAPAVEALAGASGSLADALDASAQAAEAGMRATAGMTARKGRASYLGERSVGHQDPGATSLHLMLEALAQTVRS